MARNRSGGSGWGTDGDGKPFKSAKARREYYREYFSEGISF